MSPNFQLFKQQIANPWRYRLFLLANLPLAFFVGLKITRLEPTYAEVRVRYSWLTKNPFRSIYFAVLYMAAELSTGVLAMGATYRRKPSISMLLTETEARFLKKATGSITFICNDAGKIEEAVNAALLSGQPAKVTCTAVGTNTAGDTVAVCYFTWSFKMRL